MCSHFSISSSNVFNTIWLISFFGYFVFTLSSLILLLLLLHPFNASHLSLLHDLTLSVIDFLRSVHIFICSCWISYFIFTLSLSLSLNHSVLSLWHSHWPYSHIGLFFTQGLFLSMLLSLPLSTSPPSIFSPLSLSFSLSSLFLRLSPIFCPLTASHSHSFLSFFLSRLIFFTLPQLLFVFSYSTSFLKPFYKSLTNAHTDIRLHHYSNHAHTYTWFYTHLRIHTCTHSQAHGHTWIYRCQKATGSSPFLITCRTA